MVEIVLRRRNQDQELQDSVFHGNRFHKAFGRNIPALPDYEPFEHYAPYLEKVSVFWYRSSHQV